MKAKIKNIIELRKQKRLSVNKFSKLLGVSTKTIYNWENEKTQPSKTDLMAIAHLLSTKLADISDYKDTYFYYSKPGLHKNELEDSSILLQHLINTRQSIDGIKLLPLVNAGNEINRLSKENLKLIQKNLRLKLLIDNIDAAIYIKNAKRIITFINNSFFNLLSNSYNEEDLLGNKFSEIFGQKEYENIISLENEAFRGKHIVDQLIKIPFTNINTNLSVSIRPIIDDKKDIKEIITTIKT